MIDFMIDDEYIMNHRELIRSLKGINMNELKAQQIATKLREEHEKLDQSVVSLGYIMLELSRMGESKMMPVLIMRLLTALIGVDKANELRMHGVDFAIDLDRKIRIARGEVIQDRENDLMFN